MIIFQRSPRIVKFAALVSCLFLLIKYAPLKVLRVVTNGTLGTEFIGYDVLEFLSIQRGTDGSLGVRQQTRDDTFSQGDIYISQYNENHIQLCVPLYSLLQKNLNMGTAKRNGIRTTLSLISAYDYSDFSVVTTDAEGWFGRRVYCRYFDKNWMEIEPAIESFVFPESSIYCCKHSLAKYMSISESRTEAVNSTVPVLDRTINDPKYTLSLCLAPLYGDESKWLLLAELIEHYKLQGVEHFYIYIKDIDYYSRKLVDDCVRRGEAEVVFFRKEQDRASTEWQHIEIEDCVKRSLHHSRYSIFADLDERITAIGGTTLADYVSKSLTEQSHGALLRFAVKWVLRTTKSPSVYEGEETLEEHLPALVFHNTSSVGPPGYASKCVADPRRVLVMSIHNAYAFMSGYEALFAPADEAISMHYRDPSEQEWNRRKLPIISGFGRFKMEGYPDHLIGSLYRNVKKRLDRVYGFNYL